MDRPISVRDIGLKNPVKQHFFCTIERRIGVIAIAFLYERRMIGTTFPDSVCKAMITSHSPSSFGSPCNKRPPEPCQGTLNPYVKQLPQSHRNL